MSDSAAASSTAPPMKVRAICLERDDMGGGHQQIARPVVAGGVSDVGSATVEREVDPYSGVRVAKRAGRLGWIGLAFVIPAVFVSESWWAIGLAVIGATLMAAAAVVGVRWMLQLRRERFANRNAKPSKSALQSTSGHWITPT